MFEDEAGGKQIVEFVGLRAKLYSYEMIDGSEDKKYKGLTKDVTKRSIQFDDYRECLSSRKEQHRKMNVIRSHCHEIYTEKLSLCGFRGVFLRDALPKKVKLNEFGILNLDSTSGDGTQWVMWFKKGKDKFYFDSYGVQPPS